MDGEQLFLEIQVTQQVGRISRREIGTPCGCSRYKIESPDSYKNVVCLPTRMASGQGAKNPYVIPMGFQEVLRFEDLRASTSLMLLLALKKGVGQYLVGIGSHALFVLRNTWSSDGYRDDLVCLVY